LGIPSDLVAAPVDRVPTALQTHPPAPRQLRPFRLPHPPISPSPTVRTRTIPHTHLLSPKALLVLLQTAPASNSPNTVIFKILSPSPALRGSPKPTSTVSVIASSYAPVTTSGTTATTAP
jgi:hypothetical protein